jgi:hypothetical protein
VEICGKLWRSDRGTADGQVVHGEGYPIDSAGGAIEMRACSACAGDYEDPDRTAWTPDDGEDEERDGKRCATTEELPAELAKLTHYPQASISAQLPHLRKPEYGGFAVEKQPRVVGAVLRGEDFGTVWEYQIKRAIRRKLAGARLRSGGRQLSLQPVAC